MAPHVVRYTGYPASKFTDNPEWSWSIVHPDDREYLIEKSTSRHDKEIAAKFRIKHADGHWLWCESFITNTLDADGNITGVVGYWRVVDAQGEDNTVEM